MAGPLDGIRVIEVANYLAAPACAALMADLGAEVVKVEPPDGDVYRGLRTMRPGDPISYPFAVDNRGKRSITMDLGNPEAGEAVRRLASQAHVFVTNLTPGRLRRYGLTYEEVRAVAPTIVFAQLTGYGAEGPDSERPGFDGTAFFARSGLTWLIGEQGAPPVQSRAGQGDHMAALNLLSATLAALRLSERDGESQFVDVSLMRTGVWSIASDTQLALNRDEWDFERQDRATHWHLTRNTYETSDGRWMQLTMPVPERYWARFCEAIRRPEWSEDDRYTSTAGMREHGPALLPAIDALFREHDLATWTERLDGAGCIWSPIRTPYEVIADPQLRDNGTFEEITTASGDRYKVLAAPFTIRGADVRPRGPVPAVGEHTNEVLEAYGFGADEIADLASRRVFG